MSVFRPPSHRTHVARRSGVLLIAVAALSLAACGGGDGDNEPPDAGSGRTGPSVSIRALEGDWLQKGCVKAGAQSFKKTLRARISGQTTIEYYEGALTFAGNECAGASQPAGPTKPGDVTFARSQANQALAAHWGELRTINGTRFGAIWTLQLPHLLCLLGDEIPTNQPTLAAVAASVATIPADNCFTR